MVEMLLSAMGGQISLVRILLTVIINPFCVINLPGTKNKSLTLTNRET